jgi:hypothetical protein
MTAADDRLIRWLREQIEADRDAALTAASIPDSRWEDAHIMLHGLQHVLDDLETKDSIIDMCRSVIWSYPQPSGTTSGAPGPETIGDFARGVLIRLASSYADRPGSPVELDRRRVTWSQVEPIDARANPDD